MAKIDLEALADLMGLKKDASARMGDVYASTKEKVISAALDANESWDHKGKILRSKDAIELAAHQVAIATVMEHLIMESLAEHGTVRRELAQVFNATSMNARKTLESIGVFDKLPDEEGDEDDSKKS